MGPFCTLPTEEKKCFCTQHLTAATSPRLTGHGSRQNLEGVCSTERRVLAAKFEGRRSSVSRRLARDVGARGQLLWDRKTEYKLGFPFIVQKPASSAVGGDGPFLNAAHRKKRGFHMQHLIAATSPRLTGHGSRQNLESVCSTDRRVLAAKCEGRRWSVSRGLAWDFGAWPISVSRFCHTVQEVICNRVGTEMGQAPTPQATPRDINA